LFVGLIAAFGACAGCAHDCSFQLPHSYFPRSISEGPPVAQGTSQHSGPKWGSVTTHSVLKATIASNVNDAGVELENSVVWFTLTNTSELPVRIWDRWCMWGANSWWFEVKDQHGRRFVVDNARITWTSDYPAPIDIPPHGTHVEAFRLFRVVDRRREWQEWEWLHDQDCRARVIPEGTVTIEGVFRQALNEEPEWRKDSPMIEVRNRQAWIGEVHSNQLALTLKP